MSQDVVLFALGVLLILFLVTERLAQHRLAQPPAAAPRATRKAPTGPSDPNRLHEP